MKEQVNVYEMAEQIDDEFKDCELLEHSENDKAIKVIFNKFYDYDQAFKRLSYMAVSLIFGIVLHQCEDIAIRLDMVLRGAIDVMEEMTKEELSRLEEEGTDG